MNTKKCICEALYNFQNISCIDQHGKPPMFNMCCKASFQTN